MTNLNVLCLRVMNWVVGNLNGTLIISVEMHILQVDTIVLESLLHREKLSTARSSSNVFRFSSGERYTVLLLDGAFVVAVEWHLLQMNAIVLECLLHP